MNRTYTNSLTMSTLAEALGSTPKARLIVSPHLYNEALTASALYSVVTVAGEDLPKVVPNGNAERISRIHVIENLTTPTWLLIAE